MNSNRKPKVISENVKVALIAAGASILTALITTFGVLAQDDQEFDKGAPITPADTKVQLPPSPDLAPFEFLVLRKSVAFDDKERSVSSDPVKQDICVLTSVASYGGTTKECTLTKKPEGWVLTARGRKSTSICEATCFYLRPQEN